VSVFGDLAAEGLRALELEIYGDTVTYRIASSGATSNIQAVLIDQQDLPTRVERKYILSKADATALRMDQIIHGSDVFTIYDIADEQDGMWVVDCATAQVKG